MLKIYRSFCNSCKLSFPGFSRKGIFEKGQHKIQKKTESGKDVTEIINIQIEMPYSVFPFVININKFGKKNIYCISTLSQTQCSLMIDKT